MSDENLSPAVSDSPSAAPESPPEAAVVSPMQEHVAPVEAAGVASEPSAAPVTVPDLAALLQELEGVKSRLQQYDAENKSLKEQLALHAASTTPTATDALRQIAALAAPFA